MNQLLKKRRLQNQNISHDTNIDELDDQQSQPSQNRSFETVSQEQNKSKYKHNKKVI